MTQENQRRDVSAPSLAASCALVAGRECRNLFATDKGVLVVFGVVIAVYGLMFGLGDPSGSAAAGMTPLWWLLFSVVVSSMFTNSTFVSERVTGSIEILLTSGVPREAVLLGKIAYAVLLGLAVGSLAAILAAVGGAAACMLGFPGNATVNWNALALFVAASWTNATSVAWLSIRLPNPRLSQFLNFAGLTTLGGALLGMGVDVWMVAGVMLALGCLFFVLARKAFHSEGVVGTVSV